jgi:hypothetical protein
VWLGVDPDKQRTQMEDITRSLLEEAKAKVRGLLKGKAFSWG